MFDPTKISGSFTYKEFGTTGTQSTSNAIRIAQANPYRVAILITAQGASWNIRPGFAPTQQFQIALQQAVTTPLIITLGNWGPVVQQEWWALSTNITNALYVHETLWIPRGE